MRKQPRSPISILAAAAFVAIPLLAQPPANLRLPALPSGVAVESLLDPEAPAWQAVPPLRVALNRTPPLYDTDPPAAPLVSLVEVRARRAGGQLVIHLAWADVSQDAAALAAAPAAAPETRFVKQDTAATDRFFDAVAVMYPTVSGDALVTPSLQMGDPHNPVTLYYWNAARGAVRMEARGRETTTRTGETFPARGVYRAGRWQVTLVLPDLPAGVPLAFAVWNGSQLDRDGRKYFSVWHWLE
jgi:complex iron-sulfur molybdoenzyme family reductase subunit gamma